MSCGRRDLGAFGAAAKSAAQLGAADCAWRAVWDLRLGPAAESQAVAGGGGVGG